MTEFQPIGMQSLTFDQNITLEFRCVRFGLHIQIFHFQSDPAAIYTVRHDGMADMLHVHPQLMGTSRSWLESYVGKGLVTLNHFVISEGIAGVTPFITDDHFLPVTRMHAHESLNVIGVEFHAAPDNRP